MRCYHTAAKEQAAYRATVAANDQGTERSHLVAAIENKVAAHTFWLAGDERNKAKHEAIALQHELAAKRAHTEAESYTPPAAPPLTVISEHCAPAGNDTPAAICASACRQGINLFVSGDGRLSSGPRGFLTPDFERVLFEHEAELATYLEAGGNQPRQLDAPLNSALWWGDIAKDVLGGRFDGPLAAAVRVPLVVGLAGQYSPACKKALARLQQRQNTFQT